MGGFLTSLSFRLLQRWCIENKKILELLVLQDVCEAFNGALHSLKNKFNDFQNADEKFAQRKDKKKAKNN